ncbi:hypothetical protein [Tenacibaculum sp. nBUS_03]|uniref:hypothetical protein n=1 Tax=Tenacibaculum sp. nBUS_03 TaxID=3395320 RepID=UPI003EBBE2ED
MALKSFKNKGLIAFLVVFIIAIGSLAYQNARDFWQLKDAFDSEKQQLEGELDSVIKNYQNAINKNGKYTLKLNEELLKVVLLKDTIKSLKTSNYNLLRFYRKRISVLEKENKELLSKLDSLNSINKELFTENDSVKSVLTEKEYLNSKLSRSNRILTKKVASAEVLEVEKVIIDAMKKKSNGKMTTTYRSWKACGFKIQFELLENKIIDKGTKPIHIQLINPKNEIIAVNGKIKLKNGEKIIFSDFINADYYNKKLSVMSFIKVNKDKLEKGIYKVNIYVNKIFTKQSTIKLK